MENEKETPAMKKMDIKGKPYIPVHERIKYFNAKYPNGMIVTDLLTPPESKLIAFKAVVVPDVKCMERRFNGYSQEIISDSGVNSTSAMENAETSAVGRALGMMGIGIDTGIASADEVAKAQNRADYLAKLEANKASGNTTELRCPACDGPWSPRNGYERVCYKCYKAGVQPKTETPPPPTQAPDIMTMEPGEIPF